MKISKSIKSNKFQSLLLLLVISPLVMVSCAKYEEGPGVSLRTKTARVANDWKIAQAIISNGQDVTADYDQYQLILTKDNKATLTADYNFFGSTFKYVTEGTWDFVNNKEKLSFDFEENGEDGVYTILKLKENEMWLSRDKDTLELHFVPN